MMFTPVIVLKGRGEWENESQARENILPFSWAEKWKANEMESNKKTWRQQELWGADFHLPMSE